MWASHQFERPLICRGIDRLKDFDPELHDGIVFDDVCFLTSAREQLIYLCDWDLDADIKCRYNDACIPAGTRKIFTSNLPPEENFPYDSTGAIARRITGIVHVSVPLFQVAGPGGSVNGSAMDEASTGDSDSDAGSAGGDGDGDERVIRTRRERPTNHGRLNEWSHPHGRRDNEPGVDGQFGPFSCFARTFNPPQSSNSNPVHSGLLEAEDFGIGPSSVLTDEDDEALNALDILDDDISEYLANFN